MKPAEPPAVFARLWQSALFEATSRDLGSPELLRSVAQATGEDSIDCITAAILQDRAALVESSAALLTSLTLLWAAAQIEPDEIWMELHKRERLGTLLHEMAGGEPGPKRSASRPWRVDSTKLP